MSTQKKNLIFLIVLLSLSACEHKPEPKISEAALSLERQALLNQQLQQALVLQQWQLQQQVYAQTFKSVQAHEQQVAQQLRSFSATQACAVAGNCRVETRVVPPQ